MLKRANEHQINFDLSFSEDSKSLILNIISESDLHTLLADLTENAIIASQNSSKKNILVQIVFSSDLTSIEILDSGESFAPEVLHNIGRKPVTTHPEEGGSGIGLMTTFEIAAKYKASFTIDELPDEVSFTKKIAVCFDGLAQYRINTTLIRKTELLTSLQTKIKSEIII